MKIVLQMNFTFQSHSNAELKVNMAMEDPVSRIVHGRSDDNISIAHCWEFEYLYNTACYREILLLYQKRLDVVVLSKSALF